VDERIIAMVRNNQVTSAPGNGIITDVTQVGGYPEYRGVPHKDSDADGLPDSWEVASGLNATDAADAVLDRDGDDYTNIEEYLDVVDGRGSGAPGTVRRGRTPPAPSTCPPAG
jgi:hypothetical protein